MLDTSGQPNVLLEGDGDSDVRDDVSDEDDGDNNTYDYCDDGDDDISDDDVDIDNDDSVDYNYDDDDDDHGRMVRL